MNELPAPMSDWSVSEAFFEKTGALQTKAPVERRYTTTSIGFALSVIATSPVEVIVGVVPEPTSVCPGLVVPSFGYVLRHVIVGAPPAPAVNLYSAASLTM